MRTDRRELIILRECLARVAFAAQLGDHIPGQPCNQYNAIHEAASGQERGWNALCARLVEQYENVGQTNKQAKEEI